jgi:tetratricopeptide (TPR) repeat protein
MRNSTLATGVVLMCGLALLSGCGANKDAGGGMSVQGLNGKQAADMNAARSQFDNVKDPPLTADTHFAAGQLNEMQGAIPIAIAQYEAALRLNPRHAPSLWRLARLYSQQKQYPQAIATWNRYILATDKAAVGYSNLAYCQELAGDLSGAEQSYQAGIARDPNNQPARVNYGLMLARQGRLDEARAQFSSVLAPAEVHYNIASVFQQQGKKAAARAEYLEAIKADPKFVDAQMRMTELDKN